MVPIVPAVPNVPVVRLVSLRNWFNAASSNPITPGEITRHARAGGHPGQLDGNKHKKVWIPASAGMTDYGQSRTS